MKYDILKSGTGLKFCVHNATCGVSRQIGEREIFQHIWQSKKIDYYVCPHCIYTVVGPKYNILFKDINLLKRIDNKIFIELIDGQKIEVNKQNFSINCCKKECSVPEATVQEYKL